MAHEREQQPIDIGAASARDLFNSLSPNERSSLSEVELRQFVDLIQSESLSSPPETGLDVPTTKGSFLRSPEEVGETVSETLAEGAELLGLVSAGEGGFAAGTSAGAAAAQGLSLLFPQLRALSVVQKGAPIVMGALGAGAATAAESSLLQAFEGTGLEGPDFSRVAPTQLGDEAVDVAAITAITPPVVRGAARVAGAALRKGGQGLQALSKADRFFEGLIKNKGNALVKLADTISPPGSVSRSTGASADQWNKQYEYGKDIPRDIASVEKRLIGRGFFVDANENFLDIALKADREIFEEVGPAIGVKVRQLNKAQGEFPVGTPGGRIPFRELGLGDVIRKVAKETDPVTFTKSAKAAFNENIEGIKRLNLSEFEREKREAARNTIRFFEGKLKRTSPTKRRRASLVKRFGKDEVIEFEKAQETLRLSDEKIDAIGYGFENIHSLRRDFASKADFDVPAGELSSRRETVTSIANKLKEAEITSAKNIDEGLASELIGLQTEFSDAKTMAKITFAADAGVASGAPERLRLSFGAKATAVQLAQKSTLSRAAMLQRFRLGEMLKGSIPRKGIPGAVASGLDFVVIEGPKLLEPLAEVVRIPLNISGQSAVSIGEITRDIGKLIGNREKAISLLPTAIVNGLTVSQLRTDGIDFIDEANAQELLNAELEAQEIAQPIIDRLIPALENKDEDEVATIIGGVSAMLPSIFKPTTTNFSSEVVRGGRVFIPKGLHRTAYSQEIQLDTNLDGGQKYQMRSALHRDGTVVKTPTPHKASSIRPSKQEVLEEDQ